MTQTVEFSVEQGNILSFDADVITFKYPQVFFGIHKAVADILVEWGTDINDLRAPIGEYRFAATQGALKAPQVLIVGVNAIKNFTYADIQDFSIHVLNAIAKELPDTKHIAMTLHGVNYGLDETEAATMQFEGIRAAVRTGNIPAGLTRITIIEIEEGRVQRVRRALDHYLKDYAVPLTDRWGYQLQVESPTVSHEETPKSVADNKPAPPTIEVVEPPVHAIPSDSKPHAFIAMPFKRDMDDIFYYGIQQPVHTVGLLCERVDFDAFTGDIMAYVREKIETAAVVIADLTDANPNVYLEVGYSWGKGRPTILLTPDEKELRFDVRGQRCLDYGKSIRKLEDMLVKELRMLMAKGIVRV